MILEASLAAVGFAVLLLLPEQGPTAYVREKALRPILARLRMGGLLDCLKCCSFWVGLGTGLATMWGDWAHCWMPGLVAPALIWAVQELAKPK